MAHSHGKVNRPRIERAIQNGLLDGWISARSLCAIMNNEYDSRVDKGSTVPRGRRNKNMTVMQVAVLLSELCRVGVLDRKRSSEGKPYVYRKVYSVIHKADTGENQ